MSKRKEEKERKSLDKLTEELLSDKGINNMHNIKIKPSPNDFQIMFLNKTTIDTFEESLINHITLGFSFKKSYDLSRHLLTDESDPRLGFDGNTIILYFSEFFRCPIITSRLRSRYESCKLTTDVLTRTHMTLKLYDYFEELRAKGRDIAALQAFNMLLNLMNYNTTPTSDYILANKSIQINYILPPDNPPTDPPTDTIDTTYTDV